MSDHSTLIVILITGFIGPFVSQVLAALLLRQISQPKTTPEVTQVKQATKATNALRRRLWNFVISPWYLPPFCIAVDIILLRREVTSSQPLTRHAVYDISMEAAGILFNLVNMNILLIWRRLKNQELIISVVTPLVGLVDTVFKFAHKVLDKSSAKPSPQLEISKKGIISALERFAAFTKKLTEW